MCELVDEQASAAWGRRRVLARITHDVVPGGVGTRAEVPRGRGRSRLVLSRAVRRLDGQAPAAYRRPHGALLKSVHQFVREEAAPLLLVRGVAIFPEYDRVADRVCGRVHGERRRGRPLVGVDAYMIQIGTESPFHCIPRTGIERCTWPPQHLVYDRWRLVTYLASGQGDPGGPQPRLNANGLALG